MRECSRTGPPMAPRRTASAFFAALRASSVRGDPVASIDAYRVLVSNWPKKCRFEIVTYTTEQLILEVEGSIVTALLDDAQDLAFGKPY